MGEWISVKDRLPDYEAEVLIYSPETLIDLGSYSWRFERWRGSSGALVEGITHWMPLPEPPESGGGV
jgi:hypothetical protein